MKFLLDTRALLWFASGDKKLPEQSRMQIINLDNTCLLSSASLWEITIKNQIGKLDLDLTIKELYAHIEKNQIGIIQTEQKHLLALSKLPMHHTDPFDRLIISQAMAENLTIITKDKEFKKYKVNLHWK